MRRDCCAALTLVLAVLLPQVARADQGREAGVDPGLAANAVTFRLGSAGQPFGWSTAVSDFNADGRPDVAIADRLSSHAGYRIAFDVSGRSLSDVAFESPSPSLSISATDVDADRDVDLLLSAPISGETLGVLLNNGFGSFSASVEATARARRSARPVLSWRVAASTLGGVCTRPRSAPALPISTDLSPAPPQVSVRAALHLVLRVLELGATCGPRAPPTFPS